MPMPPGQLRHLLGLALDTEDPHVLRAFAAFLRQAFPGSRSAEGLALLVLRKAAKAAPA